MLFVRTSKDGIMKREGDEPAAAMVRVKAISRGSTVCRPGHKVTISPARADLKSPDALKVLSQSVRRNMGGWLAKTCVVLKGGG